jgi:CHASE3 domain sensor protein
MIRSVLKVSFLLRIIFILALFLLLLMSGITYRHSVSLSKSTELLVHSYKVQLELKQLLSYVKDSEIGQRAFIITNDSVFLEPYNLGFEKVNESFIVLKDLTAGQLQQQAILDELRHLINMRFVYMANSLTIMSVPYGNKLLDDNMVKGDEIMDSIQANITQIVDLEMSNFQEHQTTYYHEISLTPFITLSLLLFSVLIFVLAYIRINSDMSKLKRSNQKLLIITESIKHAELIGEFFTSIWNLKTNTIIYSDNMFRLLGCAPNSFEPTVENYLKFVHPDDRHIITLGNDNILNKHKTYPRYYRIIRNDGQERYFQAIGKFIEDDFRKQHTYWCCERCYSTTFE